MASGFVSVGHAGGGNIDYYLRDEECVDFKHSINGFGLDEIKAEWKQIEYNERLGNRDLGIRGRHDARVRTTYILSMPNELSPAECINRTVNIIDKTAIKDCTWTIAVHKGEKDGITNQHVHLLVNERLKSTMKKDRSMQRKEWLSETLRPLFAKEFAKERVKGLTYAWRNRLSVDTYKADKQLARKGIADHNKYALGSANLTQSFDKLTVAQERDRIERNRLVRAERSEQSASNDKKETPNEFIPQNIDTSSQESHQRQLALLAHRERLEKEEQRRLDEAEKLKAKAEETDKNAKKLDWIQKFRSGVNDSRAEKERLEKEEKHRAEAEKEKQETKQNEKQQPEIKWKMKIR